MKAQRNEQSDFHDGALKLRIFPLEEELADAASQLRSFIRCPGNGGNYDAGRSNTGDANLYAAMQRAIEGGICLVSCDHIPRRSMALFRATYIYFLNQN